MNLFIEKTGTIAAICSLMLGSLAGCAVQSQIASIKKATTVSADQAMAKADVPVEIVKFNNDAWLMGQSVQRAPEVPSVMSQKVSYCPTKKVPLSDIASWITQQTGVVADASEIQQANMQPAVAGQQAGAAGVGGSQPVVGGLASPIPSSIGLNMGLNNGKAASQAMDQSLTICYQGPLTGLVEVSANAAGVWSKFDEGKIIFFKTETATFYLPAINQVWKGNSSISTASAGSGSGGASAGGASGASSGSSNSGGITNTLDYEVDIWGKLADTAKTVGGNGVQIAVNASVGSLTVTGTPRQVKQVSAWVKNLTGNLSQQIAITLHVYSVKVTDEDNYGWDPSIVFSKANGMYGYTLGGPQVPVALATSTGLSLVSSVLSSATGAAKQYTGTQAAVQALSTVGDVTETTKRTVITLNGQPAPIQIANNISYLASLTTAAAVVGQAAPPPTLTPGQITTGFSAMFLPKIVNGKIMMSMNLTTSTLVKMGMSGTATNFIDTPNVAVATFPNSFMINPGDTILLTGYESSTGNSNQNGVGSAGNPLFGGGSDHSLEKTMIAIVVTAKILN